jgi:hypothetical protein
LALSDDFKALVRPIRPQQDEYRVERFYNLAITPWACVTDDLQIARPNTVGFDTAIIPGNRFQLLIHPRRTIDSIGGAFLVDTVLQASTRRVYMRLFQMLLVLLVLHDLVITRVSAQLPLSSGGGVSGGTIDGSLFPERQTSADVLLTQGAAASPAPMAASGQAAAASDGTQNDNGTNPAQNVTTFILSNEYYTLLGGNRINTTYARFKYPWYEKRGSLLVEVPFVYFNFKTSFPNLPQIGGLGDIRLQGSFNTWTSEDKKLTVINFFEAFLPSADNAIVARGTVGNELTAFNLGTGKYVLGPGLGLVYAFAPNFIIAPLYYFEASAFGDTDRPMIRRGKWRVFAMYAWESGVYTLPELQVLTNYPDREQRHLRGS